ncbi:protein FRA10AC1 [Culicoides brevitarsis]|uniref:protein FRA10AC1 n=1 Tax=Culicoides brevitarsis TaxID=469753 RepID=UPI00307BF07E
MFGRSHMNPYDFHKHLVNEYVLKNPGGTAALKRDDSKDKTDFDIIRENHRFVWNSDDVDDSWEKKLAKKYFDKLFKEYTISDLSQYKDNRVALRWRVEKEIVTGKGQFICGERKCDERENLRSWEVNFGYVEEGIKKNTLVKLRLCPSCSDKLNYRSKKREIKRLKRSSKKKSHKEGTVEKGETSKDLKDVSEESSSSKKANESEPEEPKASKNEVIIDKNHWTKESNSEENVTREEEFDDYLEDLLL